jgi:hypothetical protein
MDEAMRENTLSKISDFFYFWAKGWLILALAVALVVFITTTLPIAQSASGDVVGLDTLFFYSPEEAFSTISSYTPTGRSILHIFYLTVDVINPILYSSFLIILISWLLKSCPNLTNSMKKLNILPIGAIIFDLLENISIVTLFTIYPDQSRTMAWLATIGTTSKYIFIYTSFGIIILGTILVILHKFSGTKKIKKSHI